MIGLAAESNMTKIQPLMKRIPQLKAELSKPKSFRSDRYAFSNLVSYFQGAGSKIVSKSCQIAIGDEVDAWPVIGKIDNVSDLKKRTRSYDSSIMFLVCTPSEENRKNLEIIFEFFSRLLALTLPRLRSVMYKKL